MTITEIRARFPHPRSAKGDPPDDCDYCVGGSIVLSTLPLPMYRYGSHTRFPQDGTLAEALRHYNPRLTHERALHYARRIILANDAERFPEAWRLAHLAITQTQEA